MLQNFANKMHNIKGIFIEIKKVGIIISFVIATFPSYFISFWGVAWIIIHWRSHGKTPNIEIVNVWWILNSNVIRYNEGLIKDKTAATVAGVGEGVVDVRFWLVYSVDKSPPKSFKTSSLSLQQLAQQWHTTSICRAKFLIVSLSCKCKMSLRLGSVISDIKAISDILSCRRSSTITALTAADVDDVSDHQLKTIQRG